MRAIVHTEFGGPEVLHLAEVATPVPGTTEILIRIRAAGISAEDPKQRRADFPAAMWLPYRLIFGFSKPRKPILGFEISGVVEEIGSSVTRFAVGDEVFATTGARLGAYAEYTCMDETAVVAHKPAHTSFVDAAAIPNGALTALVFLRNLGRVQPGERVLVIGAAGAVGAAAVQLARHLGAEVVGVCSARNGELVRALGASDVIDYSSEDFRDRTETYDVIFDTVGVTALAEVRPLLNPHGRLLMTVFGVRELRQMIWTPGRVRVIGAASNFYWKQRDLRLIGELVEAGKFRAVVDRGFTLDDAADAHRYVEQGQRNGAVVLTVAP